MLHATKSQVCSYTGHIRVSVLCILILIAPTLITEGKNHANCMETYCVYLSNHSGFSEH